MRRWPVLLFVLALSGCATAGSSGNVSQLFRDAQFTGNGIDEVSARKLFIRKWPNSLKRITFGVAGSPDFDTTPFEAGVAAAIEWYATQAGIEWRRAHSGEEPQILIRLFPNSDAVTLQSALEIYSRSSELEQRGVRPRNWVCLSRSWAKQDTLISAKLFVATRASNQSQLSNRDWFQRCLYHELSHAFGFRYHPESTSLASTSVLQDFIEYSPPPILPTENDRILMRLLYDPQITPGLPMAKAMDIVDKVLAARPKGS